MVKELAFTSIGSYASLFGRCSGVASRESKSGRQSVSVPRTFLPFSVHETVGAQALYALEHFPKRVDENVFHCVGLCQVVYSDSL